MTRMLLTGHDFLLLAPRPLQGERHIARVHGGPALLAIERARRGTRSTRA
jgi:hypothetical protein